MVEAIWEAEKAVAMAVALEVAVMRVARVAERVANNKKGSTGAPAAVVFEQHQKWARNNRTLDLIPDEQSSERPSYGRSSWEVIRDVIREVIREVIR